MNIYQAIETRRLGPTNHRGARIIATTPGGQRLTRAWDWEKDVANNHRAAAEALRAKLDWPRIVAGGSTARGFVFVTSLLGA